MENKYTLFFVDCLFFTYVLNQIRVMEVLVNQKSLCNDFSCVSKRFENRWRKMFYLLGAQPKEHILLFNAARSWDQGWE